MKQIPGTYTFRLITSEAELLQAFRFRYEVYQQSPALRALLKQNPAGMDVDGYDAYSWHCGIFKKTPAGDDMVGYLRVVVQRAFDWIEALVSRTAQENGLTVPPRAAVYYHEKSFPNLEALVGEPLTEDGRFAEPGRFIILPQYRSTGLARFAIEGVMALGFADPALQVGLIDCQKPHRIIYERVGFRWVAAQHERPNALHLLVLYRSAVEKLMPDLPARMERYREQGAFVLELGQVDWGALRFLPGVLRQQARRWLRRLRSK
ncbi:MAG: GNAT family N-acetyltransferase [Burkholderiales bacterium]|nr:GNAT family N-acetyltransferase [Burkholderiales bacterium]